jgi:hypothetical protein
MQSLSKIASRRQYQRILHESYQYLVQVVHQQDTLNETAALKRKLRSGVVQSYPRVDGKTQKGMTQKVLFGITQKGKTQKGKTRKIV